jgi:hypothetical protein
MIIIGMLALARRSVVQDRVDVLLKIGLGPVGKVSPDDCKTLPFSPLSVF